MEAFPAEIMFRAKEFDCLKIVVFVTCEWTVFVITSWVGDFWYFLRFIHEIIRNIIETS